MLLPKLFSGRARLITHITGWTLVFLTFFYLISGIRGYGEAIARTLFNMVFLVVVFYGNGRILVNRLFERGHIRAWLGWSIVCWILIAALRAYSEQFVFGGSLFTNNLRPDDGGLRLFLGHLVSFLILIVFSALYQLLENRRELEMRHAEAQANFLKAQINPHFLFNTLNNIYAAATLKHPKTADMVLRLSDLLRYVTYDTQSQLIPLAKETTQIRAYLELFQLKSENPLPIRMSVEGDMTGYRLEPLILLPLVENALKHGNLEQDPAAYISILLHCDRDKVLFRVENTFDPNNDQKDEMGGVGLQNIRQRLQLSYPGKHQFDTRSDKNVFVAELTIENR